MKFTFGDAVAGGKFLRTLRESRGLSYAQLAKQFGGGITPQNIHKDETGENENIPLYLATLYTRLFDVTVDDIAEAYGYRIVRHDKAVLDDTRTKQFLGVLTALPERQREKVLAMVVLVAEQAKVEANIDSQVSA